MTPLVARFMALGSVGQASASLTTVARAIAGRMTALLAACLHSTRGAKRRGVVLPMLGRTYRPGFQPLEAGTDTLNRRSGSRMMSLEPGSDIGKEPRPFQISGDFVAGRVGGIRRRDD